MTESGWFAARPSGTEDVYKIYAESFQGAEHLARIQEEAQGVVYAALGRECPCAEGEAGATPSAHERLAGPTGHRRRTPGDVAAEPRSVALYNKELRQK